MRTDLLRRSVVAVALLAAGALVPAAAHAAPAPSPAVSASAAPVGTPPVSTPSPTVPAVGTTPSPGRTPGTTPSPPSTTPRPAGACSVAYRTVASWPGGFVGELTVTTPNPITAWSVAGSSGGATVQQVWGGELVSPSPAIIVVRNASWNGTLPAGGTATVGMYGTGPAPTTSFTCTA